MSNTNEPIGAREFQTAIDGLREAMQQGFSGIHRRQDTTNGRQNRTDVVLSETSQAIVRHDQRLVQHDVELRDLKRHPAVSVQTLQAPSVRSITVSIPIDGKTITALLLAAAGIIAALWRI